MVCFSLGDPIEICQDCGCTKHASDLRIVARACDTVLRGAR